MPRKWLFLIASAVAFAMLCVALSYWYFWRWAQTPIEAPEDLVINFTAGESLGTLAEELAANHYLSDAWRLVLLGRLAGADTRLQAGEYSFSKSATPRDLLAKLTSGDVLRYAFRIQEGITVRQMLFELRAQPALVHTLAATDPQALADELSLERASAEGLFLPDTYQYTRGHSDVQLLRRAFTAMDKELQENWHTRGAVEELKNPYELLVLASIIEKETGRAADRAQISQVFHKRLTDNMRLQTDPTVIYALGQAFDGNLTRAHLSTESPFNTYRYRGLPPSPIALVSVASLYAAAHPAPGDYVYFVAKGDGASQFSRTLAEHNKAVRKYQLGLTE